MNSNYLFVLSDDKQVYKIDTRGDTKAVIIGCRDLSSHDLEVWLNYLENKPFLKNLNICDRAISFETTTFSMTTNFHYKQDDEKNKKDRLID